MKNQCPLRIDERTMKMQTRIILAGCFVITMLNDFGTGVEVSSKIDFDSKENEEMLGNPILSTTVNPKKSINPSESILRASKSSTLVWRGSEELVKASEPRKRRTYLSHNDSVKQSKIINNIQVVVNNDSIPNGDSCEHGVCNISVSSKSDEKGNIITEVHLSIITKAKIDDVPIINSFQGINEDYDKQPIFHSPRSMYLHRDNIPQIQTNYQGYGDPWYKRTFRQPQIYWNYYFGDHGGNVGFRNHKTWLRDKPTVDDKIESPLSKTKSSDDIKF